MDYAESGEEGGEDCEGPWVWKVAKVQGHKAHASMHLQGEWTTTTPTTPQKTLRACPCA